MTGFTHTGKCFWLLANKFKQNKILYHNIYITNKTIVDFNRVRL